ncbi:uncharacterized protein LOC142564533 isoform X1 [Dermacentor variabilis]|uniref:uncharacterized protein LOC142564533 isoform X1 n=1 Tax=Dermacentor variabilis TaxID=34621 RepID=UPI003F5CB7F2
MPLDKLFPGSLYNVQQRRRCNDGPDATGRHQPAARAHATTGCLSPPFDVHEGPAAKTANRTFVWSLDNVHALLRCNDGDGDSGATSTFSERILVGGSTTCRESYAAMKMETSLGTRSSRRILVGGSTTCRESYAAMKMETSSGTRSSRRVIKRCSSWNQQPESTM